MPNRICIPDIKKLTSLKNRQKVSIVLASKTLFKLPCCFYRLGVEQFQYAINITPRCWALVRCGGAPAPVALCT